MNYYAVKVGKKKGIYNTWEECQKNISGVSNAVFKKFNNHEDAFNFINDIYILSDQVNQTSEESARNLILDTYHKSQISPQKKPKISHSKNIVNVWVYGLADSYPPKIGIYFRESDEYWKDYSYVGIYPWSKPILKTRVGIAACIKAISIITERMRMEGSGTIYIHTETKYLADAINKNLVLWYKNRNSWKEKNEDLYSFLYKQIKSTNMKILAVIETDKKCSEMIKVSQMVKEKILLDKLE